MKILHTSDWHLGQSFYEHDRSLEHRFFLNWLIDTLVTEKVDVLLVSGDIYDTANPSTVSQKMLTQFIAQAKLRCPKLQMIITGGNHDSGSRLETPGELALAFDTHLIGNLPKRIMDDNKIVIDWARTVLPLKNAQGEIKAWCGAVPFVRTEDWSLYRSVAEEKLQDQSYSSCLKCLYADMNHYMDSVLGSGQKKLAMGHLHLSRGVVGDTERKLVIGGEEAVDDSLFSEDWAYVALGHLHKAQKVGRESVRYSGSPLPLSSAEQNYQHQVVLVDLETMEIRPQAIPRKVPILSIPANFADKSIVKEELRQWQPEVKGLPPEEWPYLFVKVLVDKPDPELSTEIHQIVQDLELRLCRIELKTPQMENQRAQLDLDASAGLQELVPERVFADLYQRKNGGEMSPELQMAFDTILSELQNQGEEA